MGFLHGLDFLSIRHAGGRILQEDYFVKGTLL
jgi:hypothetical protein